MPRSLGLATARYRPQIDGLRALAVLAVILNHLRSSLLPGGYLGVDVFFVISGFVITSSLASQPPGRGLGGFLVDFYARRIRRLLPALLACVLITAPLLCLVDPHPRATLETGMAALFGASNLVLLHQATDYFARASQYNGFLHTWSLGVEEQFYFLYPLLLWFSGFTRGSGSGSRRLLLWLVPACAASLVLFVVLASHHDPGAYFLMPSRFWELGAGGLLVPLVQALEQPAAGGGARDWLGARWPAGLSAVVALALPACFLIPQQRELEATLLVVGLSAALLALVLPRGHDPVARLLASRWPVRIGLLSYSLYLWHWSVLSLSRWTIGVSRWTLPLQALLLVLLATASYRWVEQPLRGGRWSEGSGRTIAYGLLASLGGASLLWALKGPLHQRFYLGSERSRNQRDREWRALAIAGTTITPGACSTDDLDDETLSSPERFRRHVLTCSAEPPGRPALHRFVVGDSHAMAFAPVAEHLLRTGRYGIGLLGRPSCPFPDTRYGHLARHCSRFQQLTEQELLRQGRLGDVVVVVGYHLSHLGDSQRLTDTRNNFRGAKGLPLLGAEAKQAAYTEALNRFARQAARQGMTTVLIGATPRHPDALICRPEWFNFQNEGHCEKPVQQELAHARELNTALRARLDPVVRFLDPVPALCGTGTGCDNRRLLDLLRDIDHLSVHGARQLIAPLEALLQGPQPQGNESRRR